MIPTNPDIALFRNRIQELRRTLADEPSNVSTLLRNVMLNHVERVSSEHTGSPGYAASIPLWRALLSDEIMGMACASLEKLFGSSFREGAHEWETHRLHDLLLVTSTVPAYGAQHVRTFFDNGYVGFLEQNNFLTDAEAVSVVHWIFCSNVKTVEAHLLCLPLDRGAVAIFPTPLMSLQEREAVGLI